MKNEIHEFWICFMFKLIIAYINDAKFKLKNTIILGIFFKKNV
jgi:hypothetical protein